MQKNLKIIERIDLLRESLGMSMNAFERSLGTRATIGEAVKNKTNIGVSWLTKIIDTYPKVSPEWLLTGKGNMYFNEKTGNLSFYDDVEIAEWIDLNRLELLKKVHWQKLFEKLNLKDKQQSFEDRLEKIEKHLGIKTK